MTQKITLFSFYLIALFFLKLTVVQSQTPSFSSNELTGIDFAFGVTSLMYGPDGRLYVSEYPTGAIKALSIQRNGEANYEVAAVETLNGIQTMADHNDDGTLHTSANRQVTGLTVAGTSINPIVYVSSSDVRIGSGEGGGNGDIGLDTNSGVITRFTWNGGSWDVVDLVRGLPRSEENHATNGLELTTINGIDYLLVASGGFTNAGGPSTNFVYSCEYALSGAVLSIDLEAINSLPILSDNGRSYIYDLPTLDDPTRANLNGITDPDNANYDGVDVNDPFGGNDGLNQAIIVPGGPVQIFSPGFRNAYDLVVTQNGALYVTDNGANPGWGGFPVNEGGGSATNDYDPNEPGSQSLSGGEKVDNLDHLELVTNNLQSYTPGSFYGGHPNPIRANPNGAGLYFAPALNGTAGAVFRTLLYDPDGSKGLGYTTDATIALPANWPPVSTANSVEGDWRGPGTDNPDGPNDGPIAIWGTNTNGIDEYTASNFGGVMQGNLLAGHSAGNIRRVQLNANGTLQNLDQTFLSGIGGNALGITCNGDTDIFPGTIWAGTLNGKIVVFEPADAVICINPGESGYDATADYDNDGYTNQDEVDNGTDPCNGGSQPDDFDKSAGAPFQSNLNDNDDDGDGILDAVDPFQLGNPSTTGSDAFALPVSNDLFNDQQDLGGIFGLGMTGLMNNGDAGANWLDWIDRRDDPNDPNPNDVLGGAVGLMTSHMTSGTALGTANTQEKAYQYGVQVNQNTGIFTITGSLVNLYGPLRLYGNTSAIGGELGYFIGDGTQSNYIKMVLTTDGLRVVQEIDDVPQIPIEVSLPLSKRPNSSITFYFVVNPVTGEVELQFASDGGIKNTIANVTALGSVLNAIQQSSQDLAVGFIGTSNTAGVELEGTWDFLNVSQTTPGSALRVNAGGPAMVFNGESFSADQSFTGGGTFENSSALVPALYQTERSSASKTFQYNLPVANGNYNIILHFAEIYWGATGGASGGIGNRVFDVTIEGALVLDNYDIIADVGAEAAVAKLFSTTVVDGSLDLDFSALTSVGGVDQPKVSAIEVIEVTDNTAPVVSNPGTQFNNAGDVVSLTIQATDESSTLDYEVTGLPPGLDMNPSTGEITGQISSGGSGFQESGGLVVIEAESGTLVPGWSQTTTAGATSIIAGTDSFDSQNGGSIPYEVTVSTPGIYRFNWRNFYSGSSPTDQNDNWLRFPNNDDVWFFGYKGAVDNEASLISNLQGSQSNIVFPKGSSRISPATTPEGAGGNGYLKVYRSGGVAETYSWQALTNDGDGHNIYVWFVNPGTYSMEISERSSGHAIDKIAMYKVDGLTYSDTQLTALPESEIGGGAADDTYNVEVVVTDDGTPPLSESVAFTWNIGFNPPISVDAIDNQSNAVSDIIGSLAVSASGGDPSANFTYSISGQPAGILVEPTNGLIYGTIENGASTGGPNNDGVHNVTVSVSKLGSTTVDVNFDWTITDFGSCVWNDLSDPSQGRFESLSGVIGDKLYVIGGWLPGSPSLVASSQVDIYNVANDTWSFGTPMPVPITHMGFTVVDDEIWSIGGFVGDDPGVATGAVLIYNTTTDTWSTGPSLPTPTGSGAATLRDNKLHFFGGLGADRQTDLGNHYVLDLNNIGAGWITAAPLPNPRNHLSAVSLNGLIYAIGGQYGHDGPKQDTKLLHVYDPSTDQWSKLADLPEERSHFEPATSIRNGKIIIAGGRNGNNFYDEVTQYDPLLNMWSELCTLPESLVAPVARTFGDRLIVTSGSFDGYNDITNETSWLPLEPEVTQLTWVEKNENEDYTARHENSFVQAGDKFYLMGGRENAKTIDIYDYSSNSWTSLVDSAPFEFNHFQAIEYQGLIWIIGAFQNNDFPNEIPAEFIWTFNPANQEWIQGPQIPAERRRGSAGLVLHNDKFYIAGGNTNGHDGGFVPFFDEYDPKTGIWSTLTDAPRARDHFSSAVIDNKLYLAGGRLTSVATGFFEPTIAEVDVYDFITSSWSTLPVGQNIPTKRGGASVANFNNKLVVIGGEIGGQSSALTVTEEYDPVAGTWSQLEDLNFPRHGTQAIVSGNGIFITAGSPNQAAGNQKNMEVLGADSPVGTPSIASTLTAPNLVQVNDTSEANISLEAINGNTGIIVKSIQLSGTSANSFSIVSGQLTNGLIKPNTSHDIAINFNGAVDGETATLTINYGSADQVTVDLEGNIEDEQDDVISFTLVNADTENDLFDLTEELEIDQALIQGTSLSIRANTNPTVVGSVSFSLSGPLNVERTENFAPYTLYGDLPNDYLGEPFPLGSYTITTTAYSGSGLSGSIIGSRTLEFSIVQDGLVNMAPNVTNPGTQTSNEGDTISLPILASDESNNLTYEATGLPSGLSINQNTGLISGTISSGGAGSGFQESNGLVVVEAESGNLIPGWTQTSAGGSNGIIAGTNSFNSQSGGTIPYEINISTPGVYRFNWRNFYSGSSPTDENDNWLRFPNTNDVWFFGFKGTATNEAAMISNLQGAQNNIVFPKGSSRITPSTTPEGAGGNGYLKIYRAGGAPETYSWQALTNDGDGHNVYVWFVNPGTYTMEISERSAGHTIDKFALYKIDGQQYSDAQLTNASESVQGGGPGAALGSPYTVEVTTTDDSVPALATSVEFVWNIGAGDQYDLILDNGTGSGQYEAGTMVNIIADNAPFGQEFDIWTGDVAGISDVNSASTTLTMPSSNISVTATYKEIPTGGVVWLEDFEDLSNGATSDNGATAWTSTRPSGNFQVSDGRFLTNDSSTVPGTWTSEEIAINGTVSLSMDVDDGDDKKEANDFVRAYYIVDGGPQVQFGSVSDDISAQTFTATGISGSTIQIVVEAVVSYFDEFYYIDNITVFGETTGTTEYDLTVDSGSGDGQYQAGTVVNITADSAASGQEFDIWTGDVAGISDVNSASTTITMPSSNTAVTAIYKDIPTGGVVWLEDFENLSNGATSDNGATAWTSTRPSGNFEVSDGRFLTNDSSTVPGTWTSEVISINGTVSLSIDVDDGDDKKEANDFVRAYYIVDGGQRILFGSVSDDISAQTFSASGITGNTIQIVVEAVVSYFDEFYYIDNITVIEDGASAKSAGGLLKTSTNAVSSREDVIVGESQQVESVLEGTYIYPNPTSEFIGVRNSSSKSDITDIGLYDLMGKLVRGYDKSDIFAASNGVEVPIGSIRNGIYMIKIDFENGETIYNKIIIKN